MTDHDRIDALVKALLDVSKRRQFGLPCWGDTEAGLYCVGQPQCEAASKAIKGAYAFSSRPSPSTVKPVRFGASDAPAPTPPDAA